MRGFVTLAVGDEKYFQLAVNLLKSYRFHTLHPLPFAIIADRENSYTKQFDTTVILENTTCSYLDKIEILRIAPYEDTIFLDADCLAYGDLNVFWKDFPTEGTACYGMALPLDARNGWFLREDIGEYQEKIHFIPQMHGGVIFIRRDELTKEIYREALLVAKNYEQYKFKYFEKPADEPILALSMAVKNSRPIERELGGPLYLFYLIAKKVKQDIRKGYLAYSCDGKEWIESAKLMHWQNVFTKKPMYRIAADTLELGNGIVKDACIMLKWPWYYAVEWSNCTVLRIIRALKRRLC